MKAYISKSYLFIGGLVMMAVGTYIALAPNDYLASMNTQTGALVNAEFHQNTTSSINMLSDLRGMGGMLLILGIYIFLATFRKSWQHSALLISTLVYAAFFAFRTLGFFLDGLPGTGLLVAYLVEVALAVIGLLLMKAKKFGEI